MRFRVINFSNIIKRGNCIICSNCAIPVCFARVDVNISKPLRGADFRFVATNKSPHSGSSVKCRNCQYTFYKLSNMNARVYGLIDNKNPEKLTFI